MFEISFPLFEGFKRVGTLKREKEILNQLESSLVNDKLNLERDIRKAIETIKEIQFDMIIAEQRADLAKKQLDHQQELYDLGLKNVTDQQLDQFRNQYFNRISAKFNSQQNLISARENLRRLMGYFEEGLPQGKTIGIDKLDEKIRWMTSHFGVVTGSPTSGKSEFIDFVASRLNTLYGWKIAYYSMENSAPAIHFARIFSKFVGKKYKKGSFLL